MSGTVSDCSSNKRERRHVPTANGFLFQSIYHSSVISSRIFVDYHKNKMINLTGHGIRIQQTRSVQGQTELTLETGISILKLMAWIEATRQGLLHLKYFHDHLTLFMLW